MQETAKQYTERILAFVEGKEALKVQQETPKRLKKLIARLSKKQLTRCPAPGKWSINEILAHLADTELVGSWRMRQILGNNGAALQAYNQDAWAEALGYTKRDAKVSLATFRMLRENNLGLLKSLPKNVWENYGVHEERGKETLSHIVRMFAGHDLNHLSQVEKIVKESRKKRAA